MIVPCDTNVTVSMKFGGTTFNISPKTYNIGPVTNSTCVGGFSPTPTDTGEQSPLDCSTHESHVQQDSGLSVTSSWRMFTLSSTTEICELDSHNSRRRSKVEADCATSPGTARIRCDQAREATSCPPHLPIHVPYFTPLT